MSLRFHLMLVVLAVLMPTLSPLRAHAKEQNASYGRMLRSAMQSHSAQLYQCTKYIDTGAIHGKRINASIMVSSKGDVRKVQVDYRGDAFARRCLMRAISHWKFPQSDKSWVHAFPVVIHR